MKSKHFERRGTNKVTFALIVATIFFGSITAVVKITFLILFFIVLTAISFIALIVYAFFIYVPDYSFTLYVKDEHIIFKDDFDNGIVFIKDSFKVKRKKKYLVLEDNHSRLKLGYSPELEDFLSSEIS